jgi:CBS domain containing-hemolysin-like protein
MSVGEVLNLCRERRLTRLPVWQTREGKRRIAGLVNVGRLLFGAEVDPGRIAAEYLSPALFLDEDLRLEAALQRMQRGGQRLAVVLARDGSEAGVVSLEDILKVIFGEVKL